MIAKTSAALLVPISSMFVTTTAGTDPQLTSQGRGSIPRRNDWVSKFEMEKSSIFAMPMFDMESSHSEPEVRASSFTMPNAKFSAMRRFDKEGETGQYGFDDRARLFAMPRKFAMENSSCFAMPMFDMEASRSEPEVRVSSFTISNTKIFAMQMFDKEGKKRQSGFDDRTRLFAMPSLPILATSTFVGSEPKQSGNLQRALAPAMCFSPNCAGPDFNKGVLPGPFGSNDSSSVFAKSRSPFQAMAISGKDDGTTYNSDVSYCFGSRVPKFLQMKCLTARGEKNGLCWMTDRPQFGLWQTNAFIPHLRVRK